MPTNRKQFPKALPPAQRPFDFYKHLDLGPGGDAKVPSTASRCGVIEALRKKHSS